MTLLRTVEPAIEPVTLVEVKSHLRLAHDSEDDLLAGLVRAAREDVERATGLALIRQNWWLVRDDWPHDDCVALMRCPVGEIVSVTLFGSEGEASVMDPSDYLLDSVSRPARLYFKRRPAQLRAMNGIEIDFTAGFGEVGTDVPDLLRRAVLILVAHWYEFRAAITPGQQPASYPAGYERLIASYRDRRL
ncbi:MAG: head-tail connector protein [Pseudaminobacter sp.]